MTRPDSPLRRHLLTRSDLAKMAIPAAVVIDWLANGALEPVGTLGDDADADPVFMVPSPELRRELVMRLASIDKPAVVLTPPRVRSFLLRARMASEPTASPMVSTQSASAAEPPAVTSDPVGQADQLAAMDLATVLQEVADEVEADLEVMLKLAEEEAQAEAASGQPAAEATHPSVTEQDWQQTVAGSSAPDDNIDDELQERSNDACFDIDDLAGALGAEDRSMAAAFEVESHDTTGPPASGPIAENAPTAPAVDLQAAGAAVAPRLDGAAEGPDAGVALPGAPATIPPAPPPTNLMASQPELIPRTGPSVDEPVTPAPSPPTAAVTTIGGSVGEFSGQPDALDAVLVDLAAKPAAIAPADAPAAADAALTSAMPAAATAEPPSSVAAPPAARSAPPTPIAANDITAAALAHTDHSLHRVESFLGELKDALVELAHRPPPPAIDVQPLVAAVQTGFEQSSSATKVALASLSDRIGDLGQRIEHGTQQAVAAMVARDSAISTALSNHDVPVPAPLPVAGGSRTPIALLALAALVSGWAVLFWFKTGSPQLALGTLIAANLVGCCMLLSRQSR